MWICLLSFSVVFTAKSSPFFTLQAAAWFILGVFSLIRFQADYLLVVGVCLSLNVANIIGFTKCKKGKILISLSQLT